VVPPAGSGLLIVDEDVPGALDALGPLPATLVVRTSVKTPDGSRGRHVYGRLPAGIAESEIPYKWAGGENRVAGNGHAIGPWSRHRSGVLYEPVNGLEAAELPEAWVRALIASGTRRSEAERTARGPQDPGWRITVGRHDFLKGKARHLRGVGLTGDRLLDELVRLDRERCDPPLADDPGRGLAELRRIAVWTEEKIADDPP
jgi:Bifunctional DNA primase/polymerase, N-terminal